MAQVLLVDKDKLHNMSLGLSLSAKDHGVQLVSRGEEAIDLGLRMRPDVLVIEWMLEDDLNGVEVAEALRAIRPVMHAILVTAHASRDVRKLAKKIGFAGFLEKPLPGEALAKGIEKVLSHPPQPCCKQYGFIEYRPDGKIPYANSVARRLFGVEKPRRLQDLFSVRSQSKLAYPRGDWLELSRADKGAPPLWGFARPGGNNSFFLFLVEGADEKEREDPLLGRLLRSDEIAPIEEDRADRVLILDPDPLQRRLATTQLKDLGCPFHAVVSTEAVFKILDAGEAITVLFVDYAAIAEGGEEFLARARSACPGIKIVGFSSQYREREFAALGAEGFVLKPLIGETLRRVLARLKEADTETAT